MEFAAFKRQLLEHYVHMASLPWARDAALHSVRDLASRFPEQFSKLPEALEKALLERGLQSASTSPSEPSAASTSGSTGARAPRVSARRGK